MLRLLAATLLASLTLFGCGSRPELIPGSVEAPAGVDFSGEWLLRFDPDAMSAPMPGRSSEAERPIDFTSRQKSDRRASRRSSTVHLFLKTGKALKVTQTDHGLFVSIDRSVVEEFTFGENRIVSVGPIKAQRVSGWQGRVYIVETLDEEGAILREEWRLGDSGDVLLRNISIVERKKQALSLQQAFDRR